MIEEAEQVPWGLLTHCRGVATDVPQIIQNLSSRFENVWMEAVNDGLWDRLCHQYTLYPASPYVIPFLIELLQGNKLRNHPARRDVLAYLEICARTGDHGIPAGCPERPGVPDLILKGRDVYAQYAEDEDGEVQVEARALTRYCESVCLDKVDLS